MKLSKAEFLKTEVGRNVRVCIESWDRSLTECSKHRYGTEEYRKARKAADWHQAQWEVYQLVMKQFCGMEYHFSRTDEYFGICTEDEADWLFKVERTEK